MNKKAFTLRIEAALAYYNERVPTNKRMTKGQLALLVIPDNDNPDPDSQASRKRSMLSRWLNGGTSGLTPEVILRICKTTKVDPNYLLGFTK